MRDDQAEVLKWIKKDKAPDPSHNDIKKKTSMDRHAYRQADR